VSRTVLECGRRCVGDVGSKNVNPVFFRDVALVLVSVGASCPGRALNCHRCASVLSVGVVCSCAIFGMPRVWKCWFTMWGTLRGVLWLKWRVLILSDSIMGISMLRSRTGNDVPTPSTSSAARRCALPLLPPTLLFCLFVFLFFFFCVFFFFFLPRSLLPARSTDL
jgi:hypothetical protein